MSRLLLQICTVVLALVPISTGIVTMRGVRDPRPYLAFLLLEIVGPPVFTYWQWRVAQGSPALPLGA